MKCMLRNRQFDTDGEIDAKSAVGEKLQLMAFHVQAVEFQIPVVYVQEFLDISQQPGEGIQHFSTG